MTHRQRHQRYTTTSVVQTETQEVDHSNSTVITANTPTIWSGSFFLTRGRGFQENLTVVSSNVTGGLGGTFTFQYSEDGTYETICDHGPIQNFSTVRNFGWLTNAGNYYRAIFSASRPLVGSERIDINTFHSRFAGNRSRRLPNQVLEQTNHGMSTEMVFLKAFDSSGNSVNVKADGSGSLNVNVVQIDDFQLQLAESGSVLYVGRAQPGIATSAAGWQIKRVTEAASGLDVKWADGNDSFDNIWDNVTALSYS